jgi:transcriptional regulator with XRE-family HTH domain
MAVLTGLSQAFLSMLESGARRLTNIDKIVELLAGLKTPAELTGPMLRLPNRRGDEPDERHSRHERPNGA